MNVSACELGEAALLCHCCCILAPSSVLGHGAVPAVLLPGDAACAGWLRATPFPAWQASLRQPAHRAGWCWAG